MDHTERQQFADMVAECAPTMLALAYLITGSQPAAERALRRALAKTARHWRRVRDDQPESYLVKVMCRHEARWWRRLGIGERAPASPDAPEDPATASDTRLAAAMRRALTALPPGERVVVALQHHERLTEGETARVLGCSVATVRRRTTRAEVRLRELLADLSSPDGATVEWELVGRHRRESDV